MGLYVFEMRLHPVRLNGHIRQLVSPIVCPTIHGMIPRESFLLRQFGRWKMYLLF